MRENQHFQYLARHTRYIDYRISILADCASSSRSLKPSTVIDYLIGEKSPNLFFTGMGPDCINALNELRDMVQAWDIIESGDIVGYIYQQLQSSKNKKKMGQFFTSPAVVTYLIQRSLEIRCDPGMRILDPACGSGQFLVTMYSLLMERIQTGFNTSEEKAAHIIENMIHGNDIDPVAAKIARYNLHSVSGVEKKKINITVNNFIIEREMDLFNNRDQYDLITGNPPWGGRLTGKNKLYVKDHYLSSESGINTFTLFIERSFDFLTDNGMISYLVPEAYLNIKAHMSSRRFMLKMAAIRDIARWGDMFKDVYAPAVSVICTREKDEKKRERSIISINPESRIDPSVAFLIPQASYNRSIENIFLLEYTRKAANILSDIENKDTVFLKGRARFFLGIVTGNNSRYISPTRKPEFPDPILLGADVSQYRIDFSNHYFRYDPDKLQQVAPRGLYLAREKILYKFIGKRLTFALDTEGYYSLNNINGLIPDTETLNIESMLSLLNSRVIQYFYEKKFFTVKVLRGNLEKLPLAKISEQTQKKLARLTRELMSTSSSSNSVVRENIEDIIFSEYRIRDRDAYLLSDETAGKRTSGRA